MTTFDHATDKNGRAGFDLLGSAGRALRLATCAMRLRSDRAALRAMPDHLLKDIGISRSQIDHYTSYTSTREALADADGVDG
ncbi:protein of unknown function [Mesorhizobium sp. NFR06]|uniref:DUF1127 domain-containing protein n=1 Tax=Mesorhizobium sp. NFR06 TaxID=1566290 RepID=UPI0008ED2E70|nr:DUF1127 domain-containing protein [Mesorhizobium sp. NFR06]SFO63933.1 protein of unknown function [Mesorhizobium sp. NFR06]